MFRLTIQTGRARHNPAAEHTDAPQAAGVQPRPALALQQLSGVLSKLKVTNLTPHTHVLFAVIMVCLTRISETVRAYWEYLDLERGI